MLIIIISTDTCPLTIVGMVQTSVTLYDSRSLFKVFFLNSNQGWAAGVEGVLMSSNNGGSTWTLEGEGLTNSFLRGVHFTSPTNGYAVGNDKTLLKYTVITSIAHQAPPIQFELLPNPAKEKVELRNPEFKGKDGLIELLDISGRRVVEYLVRSGSEIIEIDVSRLHSGLYLCRVRTRENIATKKLVIQ